MRLQVKSLPDESKKAHGVAHKCTASFGKMKCFLKKVLTPRVRLGFAIYTNDYIYKENKWYKTTRDQWLND